MFIDRVKRVVQIILNTDNRGNFTPSDFNDILNNVINEIFEEYLYEVNRMVNRENRGLINNGLESVPDRIREKLLHFLQSSDIAVASDVFALPTDIRYFDSVFTDTDVEIELCKNMKEFKLLKNFVHTSPTANYPIGIKIGSNLSVLPDTVEDITLYYLRNPLIPKWTYTIVGDVELFNPSAGDFVDIDMHTSEEENIIRRVLLKFGINLKEQDIQQVMAQHELLETQQENQS